MDCSKRITMTAGDRYCSCQGEMVSKISKMAVNRLEAGSYPYQLVLGDRRAPRLVSR